jgi:hypothetical protein
MAVRATRGQHRDLDPVDEVVQIIELLSVGTASSVFFATALSAIVIPPRCESIRSDDAEGTRRAADPRECREIFGRARRGRIGQPLTFALWRRNVSRLSVEITPPDCRGRGKSRPRTTEDGQ